MKLARKVARRYLQGGLLEPPPDAVEKVGAFMRQTICGHHWAVARDQLEYIEDFKPYKDFVEALKDALGEGAYSTSNLPQRGETVEVPWTLEQPATITKTPDGYVVSRGGNRRLVPDIGRELARMRNTVGDRIETLEQKYRTHFDRYFSSILNVENVDWESLEEQARGMIRVCKKHTGRPDEVQTLRMQTADIDLSTWKYKTLEYVPAKFKELTIKIRKRQDGDPNAIFRKDPMIEIYWNPGTMFDGSTLSSMLNRLERTVKHECRHYGQFLLEKLNPNPDKDHYTGLPESERTDGGERQVHPKRDIEFQTRLADEVTKFREFVADFDVEHVSEVFQTWVRAEEPADFALNTQNLELAHGMGRVPFEIWKEEGSGKWERAVRTMATEISDLFDEPDPELS